MSIGSESCYKGKRHEHTGKGRRGEGRKEKRKGGEKREEERRGEENTRKLVEIIGLWTGYCGSREVKNRIHLHHETKLIDKGDFFRQRKGGVNISKR